MTKHIEIEHFNKVGLANLEDLEVIEYKKLYKFLEEKQSQFLFELDKIGNMIDKYFMIWPKDTLHWWSRIWEYPYVFYQISKICEKIYKPKIMDFGCGLNFFPFLISEFGNELTLVDSDINCINCWERFMTNKKNDNVKIIKSEDYNIPIESNYFDLVYSVSVMEHIPDLELAIKEIVRILKDKGYLILTFDVSLNENYELTKTNYHNFLNQIFKYFELVYAYKPIHPNNILTSYNSKIPYCIKTSLIDKMKLIIKNSLKMNFKGNKNLELAVEGIVLQKVFS